MTFGGVKLEQMSRLTEFKGLVLDLSVAVLLALSVPTIARICIAADAGFVNLLLHEYTKLAVANHFVIVVMSEYRYESQSLPASQTSPPTILELCL